MTDHWLSPSQIQLWLDCHRKWSFQYQEHLRGPDTQAQALGTETHRQLEVYYDRDEPFLYSSPDEVQQHAARLAGTGLEFLPPRGDQLETEREFLLISPRHKYYGFIDLIDPITRTIYDHKTTSNFSYAKTEESLPTNVQAVIYAVHAMVDWQTPDVNLQWTYMRTRGKEVARPVRVTLTEAQLGLAFAEIEKIADEIDEARGRSTMSLPPNVNMCRAYGGCPFEHRCQLGPRERMQALMSTNTDTDDLLARLTKSKSETEVIVPPAPTAPVIAPGQINPPEAGQAPEPPPEAPKAPKQAKGKKAAAETPALVPAAALPAVQHTISKLLLGVSITGNGGAVSGLSFASLLAAANGVVKATVFKDDKGQDLRISDYRDMPYGRGAAVLLAAVQQVLADVKHVDCLVVESLATPEASICLNWLLDNSDIVIRAY